MTASETEIPDITNDRPPRKRRHFSGNKTKAEKTKSKSEKKQNQNQKKTKSKSEKNKIKIRKKQNQNQKKQNQKKQKQKNGVTDMFEEDFFDIFDETESPSENVPDKDDDDVFDGFAGK